MDFEQLKTMINTNWLTVLVLFLVSFLTTAQQEVEVYITINPKPLDKRIFINNLFQDYVMPQDTLYRYALDGFNSLVIENNIVPIHIESRDDFNIGVIDFTDPESIVFTGVSGALKNNFVLRSVYEMRDLEKEILGKELTTKQINLKIDSLQSRLLDEQAIINTSQLFKTDFQAYLNSFREYVLLQYREFKRGHVDIDHVVLEDYPRLNYLQTRYFNSIPAYRKMAIGYHMQKIVNFEKDRIARRYLYKLPSVYMQLALQDEMVSRFSRRDSMMDRFYKLSKPRYNPHFSEERTMYRNIRRTQPGDDSPDLNVHTLNNETINLEKLGGKKLHLLLYSLHDPQLAFNTLQWNRYYLQQQEKNTLFLAYAVDGELLPKQWKELQLRSTRKMAGVHVTSDFKDARKFAIDYGILSFPRVLQIDKFGKVITATDKIEFSR
jgi:hypothetical protein